ncbi:MAG TPA: hypothetical protein VI431_09720 [Candidatus Acidoferrum sp.]
MLMNGDSWVRAFRPVALGAREIEDTLLLLLRLLEFEFDSREGTEEKAAGVSNDGAATGRDLVGGEKSVEFTEDVVDVHGGMELLDATDESFGEVTGVLLEPNGGVAEAKAGLWILDSHTGAATAGIACARRTNLQQLRPANCVRRTAKR